MNNQEGLIPFYPLNDRLQRSSLSVVDQESNLTQTIQLRSSTQNYSYGQGLSVNSHKVNPQSSQAEKNISRRFVKLAQKNSGNKNISFSSPPIKLSKDERMALELPPNLDHFCREHNLRDKNEQIKYVNTLKRMKKLGKSMGCSVRVKSQGVQLQKSSEKQQKMKDIFNYTVSKQLGRLMTKKMITNAKKCHNEAVQFKNTVSKTSQDITSTLRKNERDQVYKKYDCGRLQSYLKAKATQKKKYPFYIKTQLQTKIKKANEQKEAQDERAENETIASGQSDSPRVSATKLTLGRKDSRNEEGSQAFSSSRSKDLNDYQQDILQFLEICQFFERIQKELLRYLPNNHLANKIETVINQVKYGDIIWKIYRKSDDDRNYFSPSRIVKILKKCQGVLGTMNYIANMIKLNVSAERRKRFKDTQNTILKFQGLIKGRNRQVCSRLQKTDDLILRKNIYESLSHSKFQCPGMNPSYVQFSKHLEGEGSQTIDSIRFTPVLCDILKFEALMK